jgi:hypothetical protein
MYLMSFIKKYPGDIECIHHFRKIRETAGVECHNCGGRHHLWDERKYQFCCLNCGTMIHVKSGTAMGSSPLSIKFWYLAVFMLTNRAEPHTVTDIYKRLDYLESGQLREMLKKLEGLMQSTKYAQTFEMLLYACAKHQCDQ